MTQSGGDFQSERRIKQINKENECLLFFNRGLIKKEI